MLQPFCFLNAYNDKLTLRINSFVKNSTKLYWYKDDSESENELSLEKDQVTLSGFTEGTWNFYTVEDNVMSIFFVTETPELTVNRLWEKADIQVTDYTTSLKAFLIQQFSNNSNSLLEILYKRYMSIENIEDFEKDIFYRLISYQQRYDNQRIANLNRNGIGFPRIVLTPCPIVTIPEGVDLIKVEKLENIETFQRTIRVNNMNKVTVPLTEGLFKIYLYEGSNLCCVLYHCNLSEEHMIWQWNQYKMNNENYLSDVEDIFISLDLTDFSEEEAYNYKEEIGLIQCNSVFPRIEVTKTDYRGIMSLFIQNLSYGETSHHTFFISGKDSELMSISNKLFLLSSSRDQITTFLNPAKGIINQEGLLYISDETGQIVSRVIRCPFNGDDLEEYYEKIRRTEIKSISKRLCAQVASSYSVGYVYTQEMTTRCLEDTGVSVDNMFISLLNDVLNAPHEVDQDILTFEILKDYFSNVRYSTSFFSEGGFIWQPYTHTIVTEPSKEGYVLCTLACFSGSDNYTKHYLHSETDQAVSLLLNQYGHYIVFAIRETDYVYSGAFYLNTTTGFLKAYLIEPEVR